MTGAEHQAEYLAEWRAAARAAEPDRYLAALLAPRAARDDLVVLAAFLAEIGRVPRLVTEPMLGEIRLRWWLDAISGFGKGGRSGNPLADALGEMALRHGLAADMLAAAVEARIGELSAEPMGDEAELWAYLGGREEAPFRLAARILGAPGTAAADRALAAAGRCYGLVRLAADLPATMRQGRVMLPRGWIAGGESVAAVQMARAGWAALSEVRENQAADAHRLVAAILPCALVEPHLRALERGCWSDAGAMAGGPGGVTPLGRAWRLWRAHRRRRI